MTDVEFTIAGRGFFAGMGLAEIALEQSGFRVVFANDISPVKPASTLQTTDPKTSLSAISAIYPVATARMLTWQRLRSRVRICPFADGRATVM